MRLSFIVSTFLYLFHLFGPSSIVRFVSCVFTIKHLWLWSLKLFVCFKAHYRQYSIIVSFILAFVQMYEKRDGESRSNEKGKAISFLKQISPITPLWYTFLLFVSRIIVSIVLMRLEIHWNLISKLSGDF